MKEKGYNDPILSKFAITFHAYLSEVLTFHSRFITDNTYNFGHTNLLVKFLGCMWRPLHALEPAKSDELSQDDSQLAVWTEIFEIYFILQK